MPSFNTGAAASRARASRTRIPDARAVFVRTPGFAVAAHCAAILLALGWLSAGCSLFPDYAKEDQLAESLPYLPKDASEPVMIEPVTFGTWEDGWLYCAERRCYNLYGIDVRERGRLRVEIYAPAGADLPDFDMTLLDAAGEPVAKPVKPGALPRRIRKMVEPDRYVLRVEARGYDDARLEYELIAKLTPPRPKAKPRRAKAVRRPPRPAPAAAPARQKKQETAAPARQEPIVSAEVLDVEMVDGAPAFVLLDAGKPHGVEVGLQGQLKDKGTVIGEIEVVEVYADGSRARILGALRGEISFETMADIFDAG